VLGRLLDFRIDVRFGVDVLFAHLERV
jgi:hypothetical protein